MHSTESVKIWNGAGYSVLFLVEVPYIPDASARFFQLFDSHVAGLQGKLLQQLELV
jgi:hypothetical protein